MHSLSRRLATPSRRLSPALATRTRGGAGSPHSTSTSTISSTSSTATATTVRSFSALPAPQSERNKGMKRELSTSTSKQAQLTSTPTPTPTSAQDDALEKALMEENEKKPLFTKILIANRGEIACRIIRTCRRLGISTVAVFSEVDRYSQHVALADESHLLGPAPSSSSYLSIPRILQICHSTGSQAVHPGYGFLSENVGFAKRLEEEGVVFIGPKEEALGKMGSKSESKEIMLSAGVPCVPGWHPSSTSSPDAQSPSHLLARANEIGYPLLIKCVSGGGGKGMKIVYEEKEFESQLESAKREGEKSFGDGEVLLEKYLERPRHVEVQIFSDSHGNHLSLFCRDCSVQRRHQKILEEAPAPFLSPSLRASLYEKARAAAAAVNYLGAGTVEFILNADKMEEGKEEFYFMEMNTRLQVEHPVTEEITGVDLVEWQIEAAAGRRVRMTQEMLDRKGPDGHAVEARIYAENPDNGFLPDTGLLKHVRQPKEDESVRMETGFGTGDEISVYYDPLIAKLIVHGSDRTEALRKMKKALDEYQIVGPHTNIEFLKRVVQHEAFVAGELETGFIPKHHDELFAPPPPPTAATLAQAGLFTALQQASAYLPTTATSNPWSSPLLAGYRTGGLDTYRHQVVLSGADGEGSATVSIGAGLGSPSQTREVDIEVINFEGEKNVYRTPNPLIVPSNATSTTLSTLLGESISKIDIVPDKASNLDVGVDKVLNLFETATGFAGKVGVKKEDWRKELDGAKTAAVGSAKAPMPSRIVQVYVKVGESVTAGAPLVMVEAMKTEHVLRAPKDGVVSRIIAEPGELVPEGKVLVEFEEEEVKTE